jgi:hypothetical protein
MTVAAHRKRQPAAGGALAGRHRPRQAAAPTSINNVAALMAAPTATLAGR